MPYMPKASVLDGGYLGIEGMDMPAGGEADLRAEPSATRLKNVVRRRLRKRLGAKRQKPMARPR